MSISPHHLVLKSSDFAARERVDAFRDAAGLFCKLDFTVPDPLEFKSETRIVLAPGLILGWAAHSRCVAERTSHLAAAGSDNVMIHLPVTGAFAMQQSGGEQFLCTPGSVYVDPNEVTGRAEFTSPRTEVLYLSLQRSLFAGRETGFRRKHVCTADWRLVAGYARLLLDTFDELGSEGRALGAAQVQALALHALGSRPADPPAQSARRAARLAAIKADIDGLLTDPALSPALIAGRHRISERYIRSLFFSENSSFRDHVLNRRLARVHRLLRDPSFALRSIADIALSAGFGDVSWFNDRYRRRYGCTPSETRGSVPPALQSVP